MGDLYELNAEQLKKDSEIRQGHATACKRIAQQADFIETLMHMRPRGGKAARLRRTVDRAVSITHAGAIRSFRFTVACGCLDTAACQLVAWHQKMWSAYLSCVCMCEICTQFPPLFGVTCLQTRARNVNFHFRLKNAAPSKSKVVSQAPFFRAYVKLRGCGEISHLS